MKNGWIVQPEICRICIDKADGEMCGANGWKECVYKLTDMIMRLESDLAAYKVVVEKAKTFMKISRNELSIWSSQPEQEQQQQAFDELLQVLLALAEKEKGEK